MTESLAEGGVTLTRTGRRAAIVLRNPGKLNAMRLAMWEALGDLCLRLAGDDTLGLVTLEGGGERAFVAGADISEFGETRADATSSRRYNDAVKRAEDALESLPIPTVALVRGWCVGGGLALALRCDLRLAREDARFAITPAKLGLGYGYDGVAALRRRLSHAVTADLLFSGRKLDAAEALAKGLCDRVWPAETFEEEARAYVDTLDANAPLTQRAAKAALVELDRPAPDRARVDALVAACFDSADYREGQRAFAEKRKPRFEGR
ncbi:enoyl-CoA hydratase [Jannaschia formosa]|uniref:enoyl-CoA hydratase n=1 Tax=Jannaschia formosa TaxID=2259592 RepID=UPI001ADDAEC5|nr:enoyl-CoA hydratase [Jannaschia formosa]